VLPWLLAATLPFSVSVSLPTRGTSGKRDHTVPVLQQLADFGDHNVFQGLSLQ
jgi:hypothetical protein